ncbi:MAG TPA: hypothetical protein V6D00_00780 [Pantanalinema sp.]
MTTQKEAFIEEIQAGFFGDFLISKSLITSEQLRAGLALQETKMRHLRIGEIMVELGCLPFDQLIPCLREYKIQIRLGELLVSNGELRYLQLLDALDEQRRHGGQLGEILVRLDFCTPDVVEEALELQRSLSTDELLA